MTPMFVSQGWWREKGRGWYGLVCCDIERNRDNPGLTDTQVMIDGEVFECIGVERHMPATPIAPGERIGLLVREIPR